MNYTEPKKFSFYAALIITLLVLATHLLFNYYNPGNDIVTLVTVLIVLSASYFIFSYFIEKFIHYKIKLIYKTIHNLKRSKTDPEQHDIKNKTLEQVNQEVLLWGKAKHDEIDLLKKQADYRREFLGNVSHELKTPICNIQGYVLTLLDGGLEDPSINRDFLIKSQKNINRMIAIIEDLEAISKLESGELTLKPELFNLAELTQDIIEMLEIKFSHHGHTINFKYNEEHPTKVFADKKSIRQVLINLMDNADKYTPEGGEIKIRFYDMDQHILTEVTDNGIGIDAKLIPRLFERFFRVDKGRSRQHGGTGLGLAIVKHIIEAHDQTINVRSKPGVGTTFGFTLNKHK